MKVVFINTQYVETDTRSFKTVVQELTGKDAIVAPGPFESPSTSDVRCYGGGSKIVEDSRRSNGGGGEVGTTTEFDRFFKEMPPMEELYKLWCPFCKTPNYAVEYRGVKTKEEKSIEQVEEQRVIEARIRMMQNEKQDYEDKLQKRLELCSSSTSAITGEFEHCSAAGRFCQKPSIEELMVMEAIWLSNQETWMQSTSDKPATPSLSSGGLACAIAALAERQKMVGKSSNHNHNVNVSSYNMLPGNYDIYYDIEQETDDIDNHCHNNHYHNSNEMGETRSNSYMMRAMAVSLAEVHATTTSAPTEVTWQ
ncbi:hypothetical protein HID58_026834 [Brassica napus]|uniref:VQ domain-containing protein n=1 Tax=Brassica napus TaxID=3708 RepID=A0ABQ8CQ76_BRANA|nr:hypothetical protein HID58_026834 [Brassica napus]